MPIYHIKSEFGEHVVEAPSKRLAVNHVFDKNMEVETLSAVQLSHLMREKEIAIQYVEPVKKVDGQTDVEEHIAEQVAA